MIHSTAIIDARAQLEPGVAIGPNVLIEGPVHIGANTRIQAGAIITGQVTVGSGNIIGYGSVIGGLPQDLSFRPDTSSGVQIGDDNILREHCTIHRGTKPDSFTVVGSRCLLMVGAHLGHNSLLGDQVILANNVLLGGYVQVEEKVFVGGGSLIHQNTRLGRMAIMQGGAAIGKDLPPFAVAAGRNSVVGINVVGLRRAGFRPDLRTEIKRAFTILYHEGLTAAQALERANELKWAPEVEPFWEFVRTSKRGICMFARWSEIKSGANVGEA